MSVHLNELDRADLLIELVKSLNRGDSRTWDERVSIAEKQLDQILKAVEKISNEYKGAFH